MASRARRIDALGITLGLLVVPGIFAALDGCNAIIGLPAYDFTDDASPSDDGASGDDTAVDSARIDTGPVDTGAYVLGDGRVCTGHDEDQDGVPDECDNCPNVANPGLAGKDVGNACASSILGASATRLAFEPFRAFTPGTTWSYLGPVDGAFALGGDGDSIVGGSTTDPSGTFPIVRFLFGPSGASPGASGVAVTAVLSVQAEAGTLPHAGLLARVDGAGDKQFFSCGVGAGVGYFYLLRSSVGASCDGGGCGVNAFQLDGGAGNTSEMAFPSDVPHGIGDKIGVRITVTASGAGSDGGVAPGDVQCQVFNPSAPSTLLATDLTHAMRLTATPSSRWIASGDVGVYAAGAKVQIHSLDILKGP